MGRDLLPEELIQSLLQQAVFLTLQSHGYTSIHPFALNLLIETVENRTPLPLSLTCRPTITPASSCIDGEYTTTYNTIANRLKLRISNGKYPYLLP